MIVVSINRQRNKYGFVPSNLKMRREVAPSSPEINFKLLLYSWLLTVMLLGKLTWYYKPFNSRSLLENGGNYVHTGRLQVLRKQVDMKWNNQNIYQSDITKLIQTDKI